MTTIVLHVLDCCNPILTFPRESGKKQLRERRFVPLPQLGFTVVSRVKDAIFGLSVSTIRQTFAVASGSGSIALRDNLMRPLSSMLMTLTVTTSPTLTCSVTFFTNP